MSWTDIELLLVLAANILGWPAVHLAVSAWVTRWPIGKFDPAAPLFRERRWEAGGALYERLFRIRSWKRLLPDGATLLPGTFRKSRLAGRDAAYLARFSRETCRGELIHWITLAFIPVFFLWNPPWAMAVMAAYGILANAPCILTQRYNRLRLNRLADRSRTVPPDPREGCPHP
ncbi:MAG: glycosyl-4,4'-diaponeurosporenoate acyltransferase [Planctomycetes bacterium]|nr:glycosyl-4,4'-diaponeurosporenoate acyltransferase [Planctomycetota bacterium]